MTNEITNWLDEELKQVGTSANYEQLPALKLQPNKIAEIEIDFSKPFPVWIDSETKTTKAIIPITFNGEKMNFWLNKKNPLYKQVCERGKQGIKKFKVLQTGTQKDTRYNLVD